MLGKKLTGMFCGIWFFLVGVPQLVAASIMTPPHIYIISPQERNITLSDGKDYIVIDAMAEWDYPGISDIWVSINGERGGSSIKNISEGVAKIQAIVPLSQEKSVIKIVVSSGRNLAESESIHVTWIKNEEGKKSSPFFDKSAKVTEIKSDLYLLCIGVSKSSSGNIYAGKDAEAIANIFKEEKGNTFRKVYTRVLADKEATVENILRSLNWIKEKPARNDATIIFIAGALNSSIKPSFLPYDYDPKSPYSTVIPLDEFKEIIYGLPSKVIFWADTAFYDWYMKNWKFGEKKISIMFTNSRVEKQEWGHGAFTMAILEGLSGKADYDGGGYINIHNLRAWVLHRASELSKGKIPTIIIPADMHMLLKSPSNKTR